METPPPSPDFDLDEPEPPRPVGEPGLPAPDETHPAFCLNCGAALTGRFCAACGQENEPSLLSVGALMRDVWENFIAVDTKLLRTLWLLLVKPGLLTNEYLIGRRQRYISPFKLYFWATALFAVFSFRAFYIEDEVLEGSQKKAGLVAAAVQDVRDGKDPTDTVAALGAGKRNADPKRHAGEAVAAAQNGDVQGAVEHAEKLAEAAPKTRADDGMSAEKLLGRLDTIPVNLLGVRINPDALPESVPAYDEQQRRLLPGERDNPYVRFLKVKVIRFRKNRSDAVRNLIYSTLPNVLLFAVPLWALMMLPFFQKPRRLYIEHLIFVLHVHTVAVMAVLLRLAVGKLILDGYPGLSADAHNSLGNALTQGTVVYILGYLFLASRRVYRQGIPTLLAKGGCLTAGYGCILVWATILGILVTLLATLLNL